MKFAGLFLLVAGWAIVLCAVVLFPEPPLRDGFSLSGAALEGLGLVLMFRGHSQAGKETEE